MIQGGKTLPPEMSKLAQKVQAAMEGISAKAAE